VDLAERRGDWLADSLPTGQTCLVIEILTAAVSHFTPDFAQRCCIENVASERENLVVLDYDVMVVARLKFAKIQSLSVCDQYLG
jgi:hypothetical protein